MLTQLPMAEAGGGEREETERVHARVGAEPGGPLVLDEHGGRDGTELVSPSVSHSAFRPSSMAR
jgi:hypothetical protein